MLKPWGCSWGSTYFFPSIITCFTYYQYRAPQLRKNLKENKKKANMLHHSTVACVHKFHLNLNFGEGQ